MIKNRNGKDLTEAEKIKKSWQEYTEELHRKGLNDMSKHDGLVTQLELDFFQCEVKLALGSIAKSKASECDGIPAKLFQILKLTLLKCCTQYISKSGKLSSDHRTGKDQFSFQSQRRAMQKCSNYHTIVLISHASKVMHKIFQCRLQQYVNHELTNIQAVF